MNNDRSKEKHSGRSEKTTSNLSSTSNYLSNSPTSIINNSKLSALGLPTKFKVLNHDVSVVEVPMIRDAGRYGDWDPDRNEIRVFTKGMCDDVIVHTYFHELVHCIFERLGYTEDNQDEAKVDQIGGILAQVFRTKK